MNLLVAFSLSHLPPFFFPSLFPSFFFLLPYIISLLPFFPPSLLPLLQCLHTRWTGLMSSSSSPLCPPPSFINHSLPLLFFLSVLSDVPLSCQMSLFFFFTSLFFFSARRFDSAVEPSSSCLHLSFVPSALVFPPPISSSSSSHLFFFFLSSLLLPPLISSSSSSHLFFFFLSSLLLLPLTLSFPAR